MWACWVCAKGVSVNNVIVAASWMGEGWVSYDACRTARVLPRERKADVSLVVARKNWVGMELMKEF
jgi:hypothetical protein